MKTCGHCSLAMVVPKAVPFLWKAEMEIVLSAEPIRMSFYAVSTRCLHQEMCYHVPAHIRWWSTCPLGWDPIWWTPITWEWSLLSSHSSLRCHCYRRQRAPTGWRWPPSPWCVDICVCQDERGSWLRLKQTPVQHLFLGNIMSFAVPFVEEPGVDHSNYNSVPEGVTSSAAQFHEELVFGCKWVQQIHTAHVFVVCTHNMRSLNFNVGCGGFVPAFNLCTGSMPAKDDTSVTALLSYHLTAHVLWFGCLVLCWFARCPYHHHQLDNQWVSDSLFPLPQHFQPPPHHSNHWCLIPCQHHFLHFG